MEIEQTKTTLMDIVYNRYSKNPHIYTRVLYAAKKNEKTSVKKMHEEAFHMAMGKEKEDYYCGFLMETNDSCVHILEGMTKTVINILQCLRTVMDSHDELSKDVKILFYMDDVGKLEFSKWFHKELNAIKTEDEEEIVRHSDDDKELGTYQIRVIHDTIHRLCMTGKKIFNVGETKESLIISTLETEYPQLVVRPSTINFLAECKNCLALDEFLEVFATPADIELESELVWPHCTWDVAYVALKQLESQKAEENLK